MNVLPYEWLKSAYADLLTIERIIDNVYLTHVVAFHSEQAIEKCFKAIVCQQNMEIPKIHDIRRLHKLTGNNFPLDESMLEILLKINELYIDSRYPADHGLLPDGKPTPHDAKIFYNLAQYIFQKSCNILNVSPEEIL